METTYDLTKPFRNPYRDQILSDNVARFLESGMTEWQSRYEQFVGDVRVYPEGERGSDIRVVLVNRTSEGRPRDGLLEVGREWEVAFGYDPETLEPVTDVIYGMKKGSGPEREVNDEVRSEVAAIANQFDREVLRRLETWVAAQPRDAIMTEHYAEYEESIRENVIREGRKRFRNSGEREFPSHEWDTDHMHFSDVPVPRPAMHYVAADPEGEISRVVEEITSGELEQHREVLCEWELRRRMWNEYLEANGFTADDVEARDMVKALDAVDAKNVHVLVTFNGEQIDMTIDTRELRSGVVFPNESRYGYPFESTIDEALDRNGMRDYWARKEAVQEIAEHGIDAITFRSKPIWERSTVQVEPAEKDPLEGILVGTMSDVLAQTAQAQAGPARRTPAATPVQVTQRKK